jgi:hypothetical protein
VPVITGHVHAWCPAGAGRWACTGCDETTTEAPTLAWAASTVGLTEETAMQAAYQEAA